jgi:hypothetical protein
LNQFAGAPGAKLTAATQHKDAFQQAGFTGGIGTGNQV